MMLKNRRVLAIDDTSSIRTFLKISLQAQGADFFEAGDATQGLDLFHKIQPDLIVLDLGLPDKDGLDLLPEFKASSLNGHAPIVIILTVRKEQTTKDRAFALGADAYLTKPFMMDELLDAIVDKFE